ncbi:homoserine kinase [Bacillus rubiinfantis]|uniref:homoserine kinase n=1 Tax=Bacillus rubiinfantis TaxID=1499680 RepID=UPI0005A84701|nr:homoserine kinase [Bacillus rubiinfantis]
MTSTDFLQIKVPASTANLGPGFDSLGLALDLFLTLEVEKNSRWECYSSTEELKQFPTDVDHFICRVAIKTATAHGIELHPCRIELNSEIPLARGLGSSAAAIVAGIELADAIGGLNLSREEKLLHATKWEGHPDNVGASLYGGLVIGRYDKEKVDLLSIADLPIEVVTVIPKQILLTKESRDVLPVAYSREQAVQASATANLLVGALLSENWSLAGKMMEQDGFHQPYRKPLIPFYEAIEKAAKRSGAFGAALSGAGPTIICFSKEGKGRQLADALAEEFPDMSVKQLSLNKSGSTVKGIEKYVK